MKFPELSELTFDELLKQRRDLREESFNLRLQQKAGQIENTARFREIRHEVAQIETILSNRRIKRLAEKSSAPVASESTAPQPA
ncbi:MAG: 50S ribosomal protein L29 [Verrucomicrobiales bacterium]